MNDNSSGECAVIGNTPKNNAERLESVITPKNLIGIYGLRNRVNGKWYIGQSYDIIKRWETAYKSVKCKEQPKIYNALKKYGYDSFDKVIIEECEDVDWILDYREMYWIRSMRTMETGYNLREGGNGGKMSIESREKMSLSKSGNKHPMFGKKHTDEAKKKMSLSRIGVPVLMETRVKLSSVMKGRKPKPFSEETINRMSSAARNRALISEETRRKMSDAWSRRKLKKVNEEGILV